MSDWQVDPDTGQLTNPDYPVGYRFTADEFASQEWPPCPVCGTTIRVDRVHNPSMETTTPMYITGRVECPNGCDPGRP